MAEFVSQSVAIGNLFAPEDFFRIPAYQRPFSWDDDHFDDLISDVKNADRTAPYFMGTMVLHREADGTRSVVDGQQRLTSLLILLACLRDAIDDQAYKNELQDKILQQKSHRRHSRTRPVGSQRPKNIPSRCCRSGWHTSKI